MNNSDPKKSSLSGIVGLEAQARELVAELKAVGESALAKRGREVLDDAHRARDLTPGDPLRTGIAARLYDFNRSAYSMLHRKTQTQ